MKTFVKNILLFGVFSMGIYALLLSVWGYVMPPRWQPNLQFRIGGYGHLWTRVREARQSPPVDILIVGSSHAYRGLDTRIFREKGYSVFNLGSSSQTPRQTLLLLQRYLDRLQPRLVIYEVYPDGFAADGVEATLDILANDTLDAAITHLTWETPHIKVWNNWLYAFLSQKIGWYNTFKEPLQKLDDTYIAGGYVHKQLQHYTPQHTAPQQKPIRPEQWAAFQAIRQLLQVRGIALQLVYAPISPTLYAAYTHTAFHDSLMRSQAPYLNFNSLLNWQDSLHFYDAHHLNEIGVTRFTTALCDQLAE